MAFAGDLKVLIATAERVLYEGTATSVILPGERGVYEILAHHKPILSRLLGGSILVDGKAMPIRRGVARSSMNQVTVIVEEV